MVFLTKIKEYLCKIQDIYKLSSTLAVMLTLKPVGHMSRAVDVVDRHLARGRNDGNILKDLSKTTVVKFVYVRICSRLLNNC